MNNRADLHPFHTDASYSNWLLDGPGPDSLSLSNDQQRFHLNNVQSEHGGSPKGFPKHSLEGSLEQCEPKSPLLVFSTSPSPKFMNWVSDTDELSFLASLSPPMSPLCLSETACQFPKEPSTPTTSQNDAQPLSSPGSKGSSQNGQSFFKASTSSSNIFFGDEDFWRRADDNLRMVAGCVDEKAIPFFFLTTERPRTEDEELSKMVEKKIEKRKNQDGKKKEEMDKKKNKRKEELTKREEDTAELKRREKRTKELQDQLRMLMQKGMEQVQELKRKKEKKEAEQRKKEEEEKRLEEKRLEEKRLEEQRKKEEEEEEEQRKKEKKLEEQRKKDKRLEEQRKKEEEEEQRKKEEEEEQRKKEEEEEQREKEEEEKKRLEEEEESSPKRKREFIEVDNDEESATDSVDNLDKLRQQVRKLNSECRRREKSILQKQNRIIELIEQSDRASEKLKKAMAKKEEISHELAKYTRNKREPDNREPV